MDGEIRHRQYDLTGKLTKQTSNGKGGSAVDGGLDVADPKSSQQARTASQVVHRAFRQRQELRSVHGDERMRIL